MSTPHLNCHVCCTPFPPEDLSQSQGIAFCRRCQALIRLEQCQPGASRYPFASALVRPQVTLPRGCSIQWTPQELRILCRWFSRDSFIVLFVSLFFGSILVLWCVETDQQFPANPGLLFLKLLQVGGILLLVYLVLASFLNTTIITARHGYLTMVHTPLPWFRPPPPLHTSGITQLFVRRVRVRRSSLPEVYGVWAQLRQGQEVGLIHGLETPEQALFVEQQLEAFLGITDHPVPDELERWP